MSIIKAIKHRLGLSVTPANNFVLDASADNGTMKLARESGQDIMTVDAAGKVVFPQNVKLPVAQLNVNMQGLIIPVNQRTIFTSGFSALYDPDGIINLSNGRITPKIPGAYEVYCVMTTGEASVMFVETCTFRNGVLVLSGLTTLASPDQVSYMQAQRTALILMNGTTDYLQLGCRVNDVDGGTVNLTDGGGTLIVKLVRAN